MVATHGRSFWILDDLSPVRQFNADVANQTVHLFTPATAFRIHNPEEAPHHAVLVGQNPPSGAIIDFYVKAVPKGETKIEILDGQGQTYRKYSSQKIETPDEPLDPDDKKPEKQIEVEEVESFYWDMHYENANRVPGYYLWEYNAGARGPLVLPGKYQVRLTVDGQAQTAPLEVKLDPRLQVSQAELEQQFNLLMQIREATESCLRGSEPDRGCSHPDRRSQAPVACRRQRSTRCQFG